MMNNLNFVHDRRDIEITKGTHSLPVKIDHQSIPLEVHGLPLVFNYYNFLCFLNIVEDMYKIGKNIATTSNC